MILFVVKIIKCQNATMQQILMVLLKGFFLMPNMNYYFFLLFSFNNIKTLAHSVFIRLNRHVKNVK